MEKSETPSVLGAFFCENESLRIDGESLAALDSIQRPAGPVTRWIEQSWQGLGAGIVACFFVFTTLLPIVPNRANQPLTLCQQVY